MLYENLETTPGDGIAAPETTPGDGTAAPETTPGGTAAPEPTTAQTFADTALAPVQALGWMVLCRRLLPSDTQKYEI